MFTHPIRSFIIGINRNSRFLTAPNMVIKGCSQDSNSRNFEAAVAQWQRRCLTSQGTRVQPPGEEEKESPPSSLGQASLSIA